MEKLIPRRKKPKTAAYTQRAQRKTEVWVSGAEIKTLAVDTKTAVWVSTAEKNFKIFLGETRSFSQVFGVVSAPALYKNPAVNDSFPELWACIPRLTRVPAS